MLGPPLQPRPPPSPTPLHTSLSTPYPASKRMQLWSRPAATLPIMLNEQAIIINLTDDNMMWPNRRAGEDERLYLVHHQGTSGINTPYPLVVKKFQNENPTLKVDDNVRYRYKWEMILLASNSHGNIINVVDLIQREDTVMLVYEYPVNGSLQSRLQQLSWPERRAIAIGVAQGLCHLHHGCSKPIVHHNISSENILLDQNLKAVIANFGDAQMNMAGLGQPLPITDLPPGNFGYTAPEYGVAASKLTEKVDTYSFGVLMLELVTGRMANEAGADGHLATWARNNFTKLMANQQEMFQSAVDRDIPDQVWYMEEMTIVFRLGVDCTVMDPQQRPSMRMALKRLRRGRGRGPFRGLLACYLIYITSEDILWRGLIKVSNLYRSHGLLGCHFVASKLAYCSKCGTVPNTQPSCLLLCLWRNSIINKKNYLISLLSEAKTGCLKR